jgi:hypothetical protein
MSADMADSLFTAFAQPQQPAVTNANVRAAPPPLSLASPATIATTAPTAVASPLLVTASALTKPPLASAAIGSTLSLSGESSIPSSNSLVQSATFSLAPFRSATLDSTLAISSPARRTTPDVSVVLASDSSIRLGADTPASGASIVSPLLNEPTGELAFEDRNRTDASADWTMHADRIDNWSIATWATLQQHEILVSLGKQDPNGLNAIWASGWLDRFSPEASMAANLMIDIGDLGDVASFVELHWANSRLARDEQPGDEEDGGKESRPNRLQSLDAYLTRLRFDRYASPTVDDEDDESQIDSAIDSDELQVAFDESVFIADSGMVELSHEDGWSPQTSPISDAQPNATDDTDRCPLEHGSYVKTDGGSARYQAFEIGSVPRMEVNGPELTQMD